MGKLNPCIQSIVGGTVLISLWFTPSDVAISKVKVGSLIKALGMAGSTVLFSYSYLYLIINWNKVQIEEEKETVSESIELELHEYQKASELNMRKLEIDNQVIQVTAPIYARIQQIESKQHPELSEEQKLQSAKNAVEAALAPTVVQTPKQVVQQVLESEFRVMFPETMDVSAWKAVLKALEAGSTREEIVTQVLGCNNAQRSLGDAYLRWLSERFLG